MGEELSLRDPRDLHLIGSSTTEWAHLAIWRTEMSQSKLKTRASQVMPSILITIGKSKGILGPRMPRRATKKESTENL